MSILKVSLIGIVGPLSLTVCLVGYSEHADFDPLIETTANEETLADGILPKNTVTKQELPLEKSDLYRSASKETDPDKRAAFLLKAKPQDLEELKQLFKPPLAPLDRELLRLINATLKMKDYSLREAFLFEPATPAEISAQKALLDKYSWHPEYNRMREYARLTKKMEKENQEARANKPPPDPAHFPKPGIISWDNSSKPTFKSLTSDRLTKILEEQGTDKSEIFIRRPSDQKDNMELQYSLNRAGLSLANDGYVLKMILNEENKARFLNIINRSGIGSSFENLVLGAEEGASIFSEQIKGWGKPKSSEEKAAKLFTVLPSDGKLEAARFSHAVSGREARKHAGSPQPRFSPQDYGEFMDEVFQDFGNTFRDYAQQSFEALKNKNGGKEPSMLSLTRDITRGLQREAKNTDPLIDLAAASFHNAPPSQLSIGLTPTILWGSLSAPFAQDRLQESTSEYTPYIPYVKPFVRGYPDFSQFMSELARGSSRKKSK